MTSKRIPSKAFLVAIVGGVLAFASATALQAAQPHAAKKPAKAEPAKPAGEVVEYSTLETRVGQELLIETTFKTTRRGKLVKYTQPALTLDIAQAGGANPIELTVPRETIKSIMVVTPAPAEPAKDEGKSGAKKN